jgi:hypothetical protein
MNDTFHQTLLSTAQEFLPEDGGNVTSAATAIAMAIVRQPESKLKENAKIGELITHIYTALLEFPCDVRDEARTTLEENGKLTIAIPRLPSEYCISFVTTTRKSPHLHSGTFYISRSLGKQTTFFFNLPENKDKDSSVGNYEWAETLIRILEHGTSILRTESDKVRNAIFSCFPERGGWHDPYALTRTYADSLYEFITQKESEIPEEDYIEAQKILISLREQSGLVRNF